MLKNILFFLPLIASCNGLSTSTIYDMYGQERHRGNKGCDKVVFEEDDSDFNEKAIKRFREFYTDVVLDPEAGYNPEIVILDIYNCIEQYSKLPFLDARFLDVRCGKLAVDKARKVWKQKTQIFGREEEIFSKDPGGLVLIRESCRKIPEQYKQVCRNMILELVDILFQMSPEKYGKLSKRLTDFEQSLEVKQPNPTYSDQMAYVKKLFMEHFDDIDETAFYSDAYKAHIAHLQDIHMLLPLVVCSGSDAVVKGFFYFLEQQGIKIDLKNIEIDLK